MRALKVAGGVAVLLAGTTVMGWVDHLSPRPWWCFTGFTVGMLLAAIGIATAVRGYS